MLKNRLLHVLMALVPAAIVAVVVIPLAMAERGYWAIGGEWLIAVLVFFVSYLFLEAK